MTSKLRVGFIGLGVMGEPMCRHIAEKRAGGLVSAVTGYDLSEAPVERLAEHGVAPAGTTTASPAPSS